MPGPALNASLHRSVGARLATLLAVGALVVACSGDHTITDPTPGANGIEISFATVPVPGAARLGSGAATSDVLDPGVTRTPNSLVAISGADTLEITRAELVLSKLELTEAAGNRCDDDGHDHDRGCTEIERHFVLVDLPTDTSVHTLIDANIPPGTYASLEGKLRVPRERDDSAATAFIAAHPEVNGANIRVEGTFNSQPFTFLSTVDTRFELRLSPPVTVADGGVNVTIHVDITKWFRNGDGSLLDPSTGNAGGANASLVIGNILDSFHAVRDDDHGHRHGGDDGNGNRGPGSDGNGGGPGRG